MRTTSWFYLRANEKKADARVRKIKEKGFSARKISHGGGWLVSVEWKEVNGKARKVVSR